MTTIQRTHRSTRPSQGGVMWLLYLFLVQTALCLLAALVLLITRHLLVVLGAAALMAGTIVGFILARTVGVFGFHLTFSSGLAWTVLIVEGRAW